MQILACSWVSLHNIEVISVLPLPKNYGVLQCVVRSMCFSDTLNRVISSVKYDVTRIEFFSNHNDGHLIDGWCVIASGMLSGRCFVGSYYDFVIIRWHVLDCCSKQSYQSVVLMEKCLQVRYNFSSGALIVTAALIDLQIIIAHEVDLEKFMFNIGNRQKRSDAMIYLPLDFESWHEIVLDDFSGSE